MRLRSAKVVLGVRTFNSFLFIKISNMGKETLIIALGTWVAVVPFLGFPVSWDRVLFTISGIMLVVLGILVWRDEIAREPRKKNSEREIKDGISDAQKNGGQDSARAFEYESDR